MTNQQKFFMMQPVDFKSICYVYPPSFKDYLVNDNLQQYISIFTLRQADIDDEYTEKGWDLDKMLNPLEFNLSNAYRDPDYAHKMEEAFYFFIHEPVHIMYEDKMILIGEIKEMTNLKSLRIIDNNNFFEFQNLIREACAMPVEKVPVEDPDEDPRVKRIKAKFRKREKTLAKLGVGPNLMTIATSISCMGFGLTPLNFGEISYVAVVALLQRYQLKEEYETKVDSLMAGADSKKVKATYWIRNTENNGGK